jgi:hypothetical protein
MAFQAHWQDRLDPPGSDGVAPVGTEQQRPAAKQNEYVDDVLQHA